MSARFINRRIAVVALIVAVSGVLVGCEKSKSVAHGTESFLVSTDGGATFEPRVAAGEKSIAGVNVLSMAHDPRNPKTIYIGTQKNGIFVTHNGGEEWQQIVFPPEKVYGIAVSSADDKVLYASGVHGGFARIYKSVDGGENWNEVYSEPTKGTTITALAMDPDHAETLYIGTSKGIIIKTTDGGASWAHVYNARKAVTRIVFDAQDAQTVYFALFENGLLKSRNGGAEIANFTKRLAGTDKAVVQKVGKRRSTRVYSLVTDPRVSGVVYVGTDAGVYRSDDYGNTWRELNVIGSSERLPVRAIAVNPHSDSEIVYSVARTLYRSSKNLTEWMPVQISSSRTPSVIQYDTDDPGVLYVGMNAK